jgi:glucosamine--fructose-6-phosphate aminotransferase (isomerizing)
MCWIFGYLGRPGHAGREILAGLQRLEYRGYDSAGLCVVNHDKKIEVIKSVGKVANLKVKTDTYNLASYHVGVGHTRWATHGGVTEPNCHPHLSQTGRFVVIHNGIIENYRELKDELIMKGYEFYSDTDTEVVAKLFEDIYSGEHIDALQKLVHRIEWAYGLVFIDRDYPDMIFGTKQGSPMVLGLGEDKFVSSDYRSLIGLIDDYIILEDGDIFMVTPEDHTILSGEARVNRSVHKVDETEKPVELGDFPHFMLKEIWEQPKVLEDVFRGRINFETNELHSDTLEHITTLGIKRVTIVASGTSYHAWLMGKYYLEELAWLPTDVVVSTEFKYKRKFIEKNELFIFVSQSGETADTLDSLKIVKDQWGHVFGVVNVPGSSIARAAAQWLFTRAGTEVGVASTKAFTAQMACFLFLALYLGKKNGLDYRKYREILDGLKNIHLAMENILLKSEAIRQIAEKYAHYHNWFYLGRAHELPIAMEWSLKLKELTYLHSEAYSSGELKHGSIALIDENFPTIMVNGGGPLVAKNNSSVEEIKARGGKVLGIIADGDPHASFYTEVITFPSIIAEVNPFLEVMILQLFSYHVANRLGRDVDKPRNLAKSVTVE